MREFVDKIITKLNQLFIEFDKYFWSGEYFDGIFNLCQSCLQLTPLLPHSQSVTVQGQGEELLCEDTLVCGRREELYTGLGSMLCGFSVSVYTILLGSTIMFE